MSLEPGIIELHAGAGALAVAGAAWANRESHGCHYRED